MKQAYQLSELELKQLQRIELEMLIEVDRICRKYDIQYSLDGGTLLGAVRHKGFIPWDDDIDVIMLRSEYFRFRKACNQDLDGVRFFLQDYRTDPYYRWGYAKLRRNNTIFARQGQENLKQHSGAFIDIFVADNVPDGYFERRCHHFLCFLIRKMLYSEIGKYNEKNFVLRKIYFVLSKIPRRKIFHMRNWLAAKTNRSRTELISHYTLEYPRRCRYGLPRRCFDEMIELEFEGRRFYGFKDYDCYLSMHYGNYMKLPPKEERMPHLTVTELKLIEPDLKPKVSIIIPVYNGGNFLKEAIDSALAQTYSDIEVIVVNDGSEDDGITEKIALSYGNKIKYLKKENGGTASALNFGIKNMQGEYFSWLSHDDVYYPDKIEKEMQELFQSGDLKKIVQCEYDFYDDNSKTYTPTDFHKYYPVEQLTNSVFTLLQLQIHACGALIHKCHFERTGLFNERLKCTQDIEMWFRLLYGQKSLWVSERLFMVRVHRESGSKRYSEISDMENAHLYYEFVQKMSNDDLALLYGTAENALCRMIALIRSRNSWNEANILEKRLNKCYENSDNREDIENLKRHLKLLCGGEEKNIVIFGAGQYGKRVHYELTQRQISVAYFMDNDPEKEGKRIDGVLCKRVENFIDKKREIFVIVAQMVCEDAAHQMEKLRFPYVITRWELDGILIRYSPQQ